MRNFKPCSADLATQDFLKRETRFMQAIKTNNLALLVRHYVGNTIKF